MTDIVDAQDSVGSVRITGQPADIGSIPDVPSFPTVDNQPRINQQQVIPTSIKVRLLGDLFSNNPESSAPGSAIKASATLPSSSSGTFLFTVTDNTGRELLAIPDIAFYINNTDSASQWPNANFGMGNMPTSVFNDWGETNNFNVVTRATIRNNSGSAQLVYCYCRFRILANPGGNKANNQASTN